MRTEPPSQCSRCDGRGIRLTRLTVSSANNTTSVSLCDKCLKDLRTLWRAFMTFGRRRDSV